jgi:gamma-glutamyltranspeptidase/glutathione hydrolase
MHDFTAKPDTIGASDLIGGIKNIIEPQKRMLSSMTPTLILRDGKPFLATGSPGGSRIITSTLQLILNILEHQMNIAEATNAYRIHHQWFPDELLVEKGFNGDTVELLTSQGHNIRISEAMGCTQSIMIGEKMLFGASDPRRPSSLALGF